MSDSSPVMFKVFIKEKFEGEMWRRMAVPQEIWVYVKDNHDVNDQWPNYFKEIGTVETLFSDQWLTRSTLASNIWKRITLPLPFFEF